MTPTKQELQSRITALHQSLTETRGLSEEWDAAFIVDKCNQYYFTGTMQDGIFVLKKDGSYGYFVRNSLERAKTESPFNERELFPMKSYREVAEAIGADTRNVFIETEVMTFAMFERLKKHFRIEKALPIDKTVSAIRAVKSPYELSCMEESGRQHARLFETVIPALLREDMNESEFTATVYENMVRLGHHGVSRFSMFQTEIVVGQSGFGVNSMYPANFDGPGGMKGMCPAVPIIGDRSRLLKKGDLVFADVGYGYNGYHTDRTQVYMFGANPPAEAAEAHRKCMEVQKQIAGMLKPGAVPADIYKRIAADGFVNRNVKFLGHGVGLRIDEFPVIADGFYEPLKANMTIAVEPKIGVEGVGVVGVEDTYVVTESGGRCITGGEKDIITV